MESLDLRYEPGWVGGFTRQQSPDALYGNGVRIVKAKGERGDGTPLGTGGNVLGSIYHPALGFGYFIEWDDRPRTAVFVVGWKIGPGK